MAEGYFKDLSCLWIQRKGIKPLGVTEREFTLQKKIPVLAAGLSFVWPGLGQAYNGEYVKAVSIAVAELAGFAYRPVILVSVLATILGMADVYRSSKNMNIGNIPYRETRLLNLTGYIIVILIIAIVILRISGNSVRIP